MEIKKIKNLKQLKKICLKLYEYGDHLECFPVIELKKIESKDISYNGKEWTLYHTDKNWQTYLNDEDFMKSVIGIALIDGELYM